MIHKRFGSSTAARTDECQLWATRSEGIPNRESSFAIDGTVKHTIMEDLALNPELDLSTLVGSTCRETGETITQDQVNAAREAWVLTLEVMKEHQVEEYEPEVTGTADDDVGGTIDFVGFGREKLVILDYKFGMGTQVSPTNNKQVLFATAVCEIESDCAEEVEKYDDYVGVIVQPNSAGVMVSKVWEFTRDQVDGFWDNHEDNIILARDGKGEAVVGKHCKFCLANGVNCPESQGQMLKMEHLDPDHVDQLVTGLDMIESVKDTIRALEKRAYEQLEIGQEVPGWKLVAKRATRKWKDESEVITKLRRVMGGIKMITTQKVITPAQMEKLAKQEGKAIDLEALTVKESSGSTLAHESDKRDALVSSAGLAEALKAVK